MTVTNNREGLSPSTVLVHRESPAVEYVEVDGETVVYDCAGNAIHLLDQIGTLLWTLLDGTASLRATSADLAAAFGRPPDEVLDDVMRFATEMEAVDLVERVG
ncbi:MAG TPA: PqqD family protein [Nocardioidaceae bacterium]|nr:PqqD family protein [Nocardioidaceae bacterium]